MFYLWVSDISIKVVLFTQKLKCMIYKRGIIRSRKGKDFKALESMHYRIQKKAMNTESKGKCPRGKPRSYHAKGRI